MNGNVMGSLPVILGILGALVFGILYAISVHILRNAGMVRRGQSLTSSLLVIIGVAATLAIALVSQVIDLETAAVMVMMFGASGVPMIIESLLSDYLHQVKEVLNDTSKKMA